MLIYISSPYEPDKRHFTKMNLERIEKIEQYCKDNNIKYVNGYGNIKLDLLLQCNAIVTTCGIPIMWESKNSMNEWRYCLKHNIPVFDSIEDVYLSWARKQSPKD